MRRRLLFAILSPALLGCAVAAGVGLAALAAAPAAGDPPPATQPGRFDIPVWDPAARWKMDATDYAHDTNLIAQLDGPRHEVMWGGHNKYPTLRAGLAGSGRYVFTGYDAAGDRYHGVTGGSAGYLDGPFSRARFYVSDYHGYHERAYSADGRFFYFLADFWRQRVRALDFAEQRVSTLPADGSAVACGPSGKVYLTQGGKPVASIAVLSPGPEWKLLRTQAVQDAHSINALGTSLAVDEKHGRLYGTTYGARDWYVWYWDLADGSYHGVLPNCDGKPGARARGEPGPFDGTSVYNHGEITWGPDDPDCRFLYMTRVDDGRLYRLDLEKRVMAVFSVAEGRFVDKGRGGMAAYSMSPYWFSDGSFQGCIPWYMTAPHYRFFKRVK